MKTQTTMTTMEHRNLAMNAPITRTYIESLRRQETGAIGPKRGGKHAEAATAKARGKSAGGER